MIFNYRDFILLAAMLAITFFSVAAVGVLERFVTGEIIACQVTLIDEQID